MKKKIDYKIVVIITLIIVLTVIIYFYFNPSNITVVQDTSTSEVLTSDDKTISQASVETKTIAKTISSTGEVSSNLKEKLDLHSTYYFSEIYYTENQYVEEGANILKYTNGKYMTAPYNLVITSINVPDKYSQCTSKHYIEVSSTDILTMNLKVDEDELSDISVGKEAQIRLPVLEDKTYTGYVTNIASTATYSSNGSKFTVTVEFNNDGEILLGMTASCLVVLDKVENVLAVPLEALTTVNNKSYVTVVNNETTEQTLVETGFSNDAYIEIKSGLTEGQTVQIVKQTTYSSSKTIGGQRENMSQNSGEKEMMMQQMQQAGQMPSDASGGSISQMP